nr:SDR family NAD(P)-dependent oxidoreductase [Bacillus paralicheniformis]
MNSQKILRALQAGEISREEAKRLLTLEPSSEEAIAIVGMSGRYPDASNLNMYWENLSSGTHSVREIPQSRWDVASYYDPRPGEKGKVNCKWLGMLDNVDQFDPLFFNISPADAEEMDPQHRIFLQEGYKAFEDAGYSASSLDSINCGVYLGIMSNEYGLLLYDNQTETNTTSNSFAIGASRLPYFLNLKGPAIPIDTACSSSLVGTHLARQALLNKEIDMALVGGVTLYLTKDSYISMCRAGMLSPDGQCKTFDNDANGFVPGEGAGALVLKRLKDAEADHDHIYGVILGSGINQDGKTNGITAPSVKSQIELEREIYRKYNIDPESISYVEMHGTGTPLGDPIELEALSTVFSERTKKKNYCAIGSVKSNIGHTSAAAGVASIQKVLLSLRHRQLVPTLHFQTPNEYFDFDNSPFYVNTELKSWETDNGKPRRAGVSSFGFSGTNAHLVIEEYRPTYKLGDESPHHKNDILFVLSARSRKQLNTYAASMSAFLEVETTVDLANLAFTLQVGREAMRHRLAIVANSRDSLMKQLELFSEDIMEGPMVYCNVQKGRTAFHSNRSRDEVSLSLSTWLKRGQLMNIAKAWTEGLWVDWETLYGDKLPRRIPLPTYPFAKESYWYSKEEKQNNLEETHTGTLTGVKTLHPLVHENNSDLLEQRFSTTFAGREFYLRDHAIHGDRILAGVSYLEMARAAVQLSINKKTVDTINGIRLQDIRWIRPYIHGQQPDKLHISLYPNDDDIEFKIYSENEANAEDKITHSQGLAVLDLANQRPVLNLQELLDHCNEHTFSGQECYENYMNMGIEYGPGQRSVESLHVGDGQLLAQLRLPDALLESFEEYVLHPSLMDGALHASIGFMLNDSSFSHDRPLVPYALQNLEVFASCEPKMWAYIRRSEDSTPQGRTQNLDVDVCDEQGNVCIRIEKFSLHRMEKKVDSKLQMMYPDWREQTVHSDGEIPESLQRVVYICEPDGNKGFTSERIKSHLGEAECIILDERPNPVEDRFQVYALKLFERIQRMLSQKRSANIFIQLLVMGGEEQQLFAALSGLLKTAALEFSKLTFQLIEMENDTNFELLIKRLQDNFRSFKDQHIRYIDRKRYVSTWSKMKLESSPVRLPWKEDGVYLITGGAGGLGFVFAKEAVRQGHSNRVIITGRSKLDAAKQNQLQKWHGQIEYRQMDVTNPQEVTRVVKSITKQYGRLDGIVHSAGIHRDNFIGKKKNKEFLDVMAPKVKGAMNLDQACQNVELDFFILFSSLAGALGNSGQADYATANAFLDMFAKYRNELVTTGERYGRTLSLNWPLWQEGGMKVDRESDMMLRSMGLKAINSSTGIQAFNDSYLSESSQVMVLYGNPIRINERLGAVNVTSPWSKPVNLTEDNEALFEKVKLTLTSMVSNLLKVKTVDLELDVELHEYGFDSIKFTEFANRLNHEYKLELTPAIFFEYPTLHSLAEYMSSHYQDTFAEIFGMSIGGNNPNKARTAEPVEQFYAEEQPKRFFRKTDKRRTKQKNEQHMDQKKQEPIAIIGMSGKFPMASDLDEFWENLQSGKDCIEEIPSDRWDWREYYGDPAKEANKTNIKWGGFIDGVAEFDPLFFGISPKEAEFIDPQQRLLMMYVWKVIEDAGYSTQSLAGTDTAIFVGTAGSGYSNLFTKAKLAVEGFTSTGVAPSVGPNRMSFMLDLHGPSEPIETACSSSLVAIHRAVASIQSGHCEMAIVGGVNTIIVPEFHISFNKAGMLSEDGRCKTFSDKANGYVRGEGVGMLFLKKLSEAERDRDHIYGIIRGTSENHGGRANSLTSPNPRSQANVLKSAYTSAGIDPRTVTYIETHGTGTELGDPVEINGLKSAFQELGQVSDQEIKEAHCGLGSVKTNIGHLELAAGVAGVIKVLLQLKHKTLVKSLHSETINPYIQLKDSPFYILQEKRKWNTVRDDNGYELPRRAGVSSFGFGGVNAHIILEEYTPSARSARALVEDQQHIIVLSAKNEARLMEKASQLASYLEMSSANEVELIDLAYTLQVGRDAMDERLALIVESVSELKAKLQEYVHNGDNQSDVYRGQAKQNRHILALFNNDDELQEAIHRWMKRGKYSKLLDLWVRGVYIDWEKMYGNPEPCRISLPTYPFAKERYWVPTAADVSYPKQLHPLVHQNTSNLSGLQYFSTFTGQEPFWDNKDAVDDIIRASIKLAADENSLCSVRLKDVIVHESIEVGQPVEVNIKLHSDDLDCISFEIYSKNPNQEGSWVLRRSGLAVMESPQEVSCSNVGQLEAGMVKLVPSLDFISLLPEHDVNLKTGQLAVVQPTMETRRSLEEQQVPFIELDIEPGDKIEQMVQKLSEIDSVEHLLWIVPDETASQIIDDRIIQDQERGVIFCFRLIKALLLAGYGERQLRWTVITTQTLAARRYKYNDPTHAGVHGLIGSMAKEFPHWKVQLLDIERGTPWVCSDWDRLPSDTKGNAIVQQGKEWYQRKLIPAQMEAKDAPVLYRQQGVYVVVGGAGGIGEVWTEYMIRTYQAQIVWIGRREVNEEIQAKIERLSSLGSAPLYIKADATDQADLERAYKMVRQRYGCIHGVVHSAIVLSDQSLFKMEEERFREGLSAKVDVSVRVAQVFSEEALDFMLFFSSMVAFARPSGQSNYAAGCTFKDAYAQRLAAEYPCAVKVINWGYWGSVGIVASKAYQERMAQTGIGSIEPHEAMETLEQLMSSPFNQVALMKTTKEMKIEGVETEELLTVLPQNTESTMDKLRSLNAPDFQFHGNGDKPVPILDELKDTLLDMLSRLLRVKREEFDSELDLGEYGLDQIHVTELANQLNDRYEVELRAAELQEHLTLQHLAEYLHEAITAARNESRSDKGGIRI